MHYKDGTEAKLLDIIRGRPYNTPHEVIGVVVGLTPGTPIQRIDHGEVRAFEKVPIG